METTQGANSTPPRRQGERQGKQRAGDPVQVDVHLSEARQGDVQRAVLELLRDAGLVERRRLKAP